MIADGSALWENVIEVGEVNVGLRKLTNGVTVIATPPPNESAGSFSANNLLDQQLPSDGWRSTWTAWNKVNPQLTFNLGREKDLSHLRIYFQPYDRADELKEVEVYVADEEMNFSLHKVFPGIVSPLEKGKFMEIDMSGVSTRAIRLEPKYQGWGHMWERLNFGSMIPENLRHQWWGWSWPNLSLSFVCFE